MSFVIELQQNSSEDNRLDKTLTTLFYLEGVLKDGTSIMTPSVLVQASPSSLAICNYATISAFGRRYYVTNISAYRGDLSQIDLKVDVLTSWKQEIRNCTGIVYKQENLWNLYLDDGTFKCYQNPIMGSFQFPGGFNSLNYILAVAGNA